MPPRPRYEMPDFIRDCTAKRSVYREVSPWRHGDARKER